MAEALTLAPLPGVWLRVAGDPAAVNHLAAEYGDAPNPSAGTPVAELQVHFVHRLPGAAEDGHKTIRWAATLERTGAHALRLSIALRGRPRWFGLSLVQGYLVEPALSFLAVEAGGVLVPAAGLVPRGSAVLLIGRSGAGKSSLALRALAAGIPLLGDDQVFVEADGTCTRFPRRLRLYDDSRRTAPAVTAGLPARYRAGLAGRRLLRLVSRGAVAPSLAVPATAVRGAVLATRAPLERVVLLDRRPAGGDPHMRTATPEEAGARAREALAEQRGRLLHAIGPRWPASIAEVAEREDGLLRQAFSGARISAIEVPTLARSELATDAVASALNLPM